MVSSIQLRFHLTKKSQGGIGLVWSWEAVSQGRGYWPACSGQLSRHNPTGEGDSLGMSGQSRCSCHGSVSCKGCSEPLGPGLPGRFLLVLAGLQLSEVSFSCLGSALGSSMPQASLYCPSWGLQLTHTSLLCQGSQSFCLCFIASTIQPRIGKEHARG